jgi:predicted nuclease of predicted toxin-antitoxin system
VGSVGFFFDENLPARIARALEAVQIPVFNAEDEGLQGKSDLDIIKLCQRGQLVLVTKDRNILRNPIERDALSSAGIGVINVQAGKANLRELFKLLVKRLEDMEEVLGDDQPRVYVLSDRSFQTLDKKLARRDKR